LADGALPAGHNGPYHHPETPVRNTAHWAISFARAWELTGEARYRSAAEHAVDYVVACFEQTGRTAVRCRNHARKDAVNGVMGQAWIIEGLVEAGQRLKRDDALEAAAELFAAHPYRSHEGAWQRLALGGSPNGFDWTFNHQLWFCAAGSLLIGAGFDQPRHSVNNFVCRLEDRLSLYPSGLIRHANTQFLRGGWRTRAQRVARGAYFGVKPHAMWTKSIGYHCFNTFALALIHQNLPEWRLLQSESVGRAFDYIRSKEFARQVGVSRFGFPYNPPGIEAAFSIETAFPEDLAAVDQWIERQIKETYDNEEGTLVRQAADPATAWARVYEAARLV
jgi:hypothetical protein